MLFQNPRFRIFSPVAVELLALISFAASPTSVRYDPVSREVVEARLGKYGGDNAQREASLKNLFADAGCDEQHISEQKVKGSKLPNVMCLLPGSSDKVILVGAHFDHVSAGDGVVDNWSGASLLPSLFQSLKNESRKHTFIFIGFTDEEKGEIVSHFYARHMTREEVAATDAMVNMDTLGLGPTEIWSSHSDQQLSADLATIAKQLNISVTGMNVDKIGSSDSEQFVERKIPRITIHSLTQETWNARILHTPKDVLSAVRLDDYYQTYTLVSAYLAYLDQVAGSRAAD